jgi:hypothetical protein
MPTIPCNRDFLCIQLGEVLSHTQFEDLCFHFGIELAEITTAKEMFERERGGGGTGAAILGVKLETSP